MQDLEVIPPRRYLNALSALLKQRFADPAVEVIQLTSNHYDLALAALHRGVDLAFDFELGADIVVFWKVKDPSTRLTDPIPNLELNHIEFYRDGTHACYVNDTNGDVDDGPFLYEDEPAST